jgi:hypothetical protein
MLYFHRRIKLAEIRIEARRQVTEASLRGRISSNAHHVIIAGFQYACEPFNDMPAVMTEELGEQSRQLLQERTELLERLVNHEVVDVDLQQSLLAAVALYRHMATRSYTV